MSEQRKYSFWRRLGIFVFGFFFGIFALLGSIAGAGYWAYKNFSLQMLKNFGINFGPVIKDDSPLLGMSIEKWIQEFSGIASGAQNSSIKEIQAKYGISLTDSLSFLPPALLDVPLMKLASSEGLNYVLANTNGDWVLSLIGEGKLPAFVDKVLKGKPLSTFTSGDMQKILDGVYVGDVMGYKMGAEKPEVVLAETTAKKYNWTDSADAPISVIMDTVANILLPDLMSGSFDMADSLGSLYAGDVMEYKRGAIKEGSDPTAPKYNWTDKQNVALTAINETVANIKFDDLMSGSFDFTSALNDLYVGDVMNYTKQGLKIDATPEVPQYNWVDSKNTPVVGIEDTIANVAMGSLMGGSFQFASVFSGQYVGEIMKYVRGNELPASDPIAKKKYEWHTAGTEVPSPSTRLTGMSEVIANIDMGELLGGTFDANALVGDIKLGDVIAFNENTPSIFVALGADSKVSELSSKINSVSIGDVMGLRRIQVGTDVDGNPIWQKDEQNNDIWYKAKSNVGEQDVPATGVMSIFAKLTVASIGDSNEVEKCINAMKLSDVITFDENSSSILVALKDKTIVELSGAINTLAVGEILGLRRKEVTTDGEKKWETDANGKDIWYEKINPANPNEYILAKGMMSAFANLSMQDMSGGKFQSTLESLTIGEIITIDPNSSGLLQQLKDVQIKNLSTEINTITFGSVMGLTKTEDVWYESNGTPATGMTKAFADLKIGAMTAADFEASINTLSVGDIFKAPTGGSNMMSLVPVTTKITELPTAMATAIQTSTMGTLADAGMFDTGLQTSFNAISKVLYAKETNSEQIWKTKTLTEFFLEVATTIAKIPAVPN